MKKKCQGCIWGKALDYSDDNGINIIYYCPFGRCAKRELALSMMRSRKYIRGAKNDDTHDPSQDTGIRDD